MWFRTCNLDSLVSLVRAELITLLGESTQNNAHSETDRESKALSLTGRWNQNSFGGLLG